MDDKIALLEQMDRWKLTHETEVSLAFREAHLALQREIEQALISAAVEACKAADAQLERTALCDLCYADGTCQWPAKCLVTIDAAGEAIDALVAQQTPGVSTGGD